MKRILRILLVFCLLLVSCTAKEVQNEAQRAAQNEAKSTNNSEGEKPATEPFALYPAHLQLPLGQHVTLDPEPLPMDSELVWSSSNTSVASVDDNGRISPVKEGEAVITCTLKDDPSFTATCGVLVTADGNIFLWEYELTQEEKDALHATIAEASPATE